MSPIPDLPNDSTPSPSDGSAPQRSGSNLLGALPAVAVVGTLVVLAAIFALLAGCFYRWRKRSMTSAKGISCCPNLRKLFPRYDRASSDTSNDGSTVGPATSRPLLPQPFTNTDAPDSNTRASQNTCIGEGTDTLVADGQVSLCRISLCIY